MERTDFDFTDAVEFFKECVPLSELQEDVQEAMGAISGLKKRIGKKAFHQLWHTLLTCADFFETIEVK